MKNPEISSTADNGGEQKFKSVKIYYLQTYPVFPTGYKSLTHVGMDIDTFISTAWQGRIAILKWFKSESIVTNLQTGWWTFGTVMPIPYMVRFSTFDRSSELKSNVPREYRPQLEVFLYMLDGTIINHQWGISHGHPKSSRSKIKGRVNGQRTQKKPCEKPRYKDFNLSSILI